MKTGIPLAAALAVLVLSLAGCNKASTPPADTNTSDAKTDQTGDKQTAKSAAQVTLAITGMA